MLGFDRFETAEETIFGIEIMHRIIRNRLKKFNLSFLRLNFPIKLWASQL